MDARLILVGGGAFARELINWIDDLVYAGKSRSISGFIADGENLLSGYNYGIPCLGTVLDYAPRQDDQLLMAVAEPNAKRDLYQVFKEKRASFTQMIHPSAIIARTAILGEGVVVCPNALISADAVVGDLCSINVQSSIGHDAVIGKFATISSHVDITGWVTIGECAFFGSGSRVLPNLNIGKAARIGAGSVVVRNVPDHAATYTQPAKRL